jgi:hypothetical protein
MLDLLPYQGHHQHTSDDSPAKRKPLKTYCTWVADGGTMVGYERALVVTRLSWAAAHLSDLAVQPLTGAGLC